MKNLLGSLIIVIVGCKQWLLTGAETLLWNVTSGSDEVCMLMKMAADITHPVYRTVSTIPKNAILSSGSQLESCPEDFAVLELSWTDKDFNWTMEMNFNVTESTYALTMIYGSVVNKGGSTRREWSYREYSYPVDVPISSSIVCDYLWTRGGIFTEIRWQPFAQNTDGDFGPEKECQKRSLSSGSALSILIIAVVAVIAAILVAVFVHNRR